MRKQYLKPEIEFIQFNYRDVVATSDGEATPENVSVMSSVRLFSTVIQRETSASDSDSDSEPVWSDQ